MSQRYECYDADATDIKIVPPGSEIGEDDADDHALIVGNPWSAALALFGGLDGIERFAYRVLTEAKKTRARLDTDQAPTAVPRAILAPLPQQHGTAAAPEISRRDVVTGDVLGPAEHWQTGDIVLAADRQLWCRAADHHAAEGWPWAYVHSYAPRQHGDSLPEGAVDEQTPARPLALLLRDGWPVPSTGATPQAPGSTRHYPALAAVPHSTAPAAGPATS